ncbi:MAG: FG-GAP-like repeat-containing protein [Candidatus Acidiferrales bacterium]
MIRRHNSKSGIYLGIFLLAALSLSASIAQARPAVPVPFVDAISPVSVAPGGADLTLTVNGVNFANASVVYWGTTALTTTYVSGTQLTAVVPAALTATGGTGWITVSTPGSPASNTIFLPVGSTTSSLNFTNTQLTAGSVPYLMTQGDFNGDGKMDLAVANWGGSNVSVFLSNGDGTFQPAQTIALPAEAFSITAADFNNDGKLDLAVGYESEIGVSILLGNGDGTFQAPISTAAGGSNYALVAGDFNKDGKLDLAVAGYFENTVYVLIGNGDGTFQAAVPYPISGDPLHIYEADLNGDGNLDLVAGAYYGSNVSVLIGVGDGTFQSAQEYAAGTNAADVAIGDFNGDGKLDLVASSEDNNIYFLAGVGDGTFLDAQAIPVGLSPAAIGVGDFNNDGKLDVVIASNSGSAGVILSNGDGTFQQAQQFPLPGVSSPFSLVVGNFNTGGGLGIAVADNSGIVDVLIQTLSVSPSTFDFGNQGVGAASTVQDFTIANSTSQTVTFTSIAFTGTNSSDFSDTTDCAATLAPGASCTVHVTFTPGDLGARSATLNVTDNAPASPQTAAITGTGVAAPIVTFSAPAIAFSSEPVGTASGSQSVTVTNTGNAILNISSIAVTGTNSGDFSLAPTGTCGATLAVQDMCTINVTFTPSAAGTRSASVAITDDAPNSPQSITLSGTGLLEPTADLSGTTLTYAAAAVGSTSASQSVTLTNNGGQPLTITSIVTGGTNGGDFASTNTCTSPIAPAAHCTINAAFTPTAGGARTATITITDNATTSPQVITLQGTGQDFSLSVSSIGAIKPGNVGDGQLTITAAGGYSAPITFTCSGAPMLSTCNVSPSPVTPTGATTHVSVTLTTTGPAKTAALPGSPSMFPPAGTRPFLLAAFLGTLVLMALAFFAPGLRKLRVVRFALPAVLLVAAIGLGACDSMRSTPAGEYTLTVTATSGTLSHSVNVPVTVQ